MHLFPQVGFLFSPFVVWSDLHGEDLNRSTDVTMVTPWLGDIVIGTSFCQLAD